MRYSLQQEFYKLVHRKITWIIPLLLLGLMILTGLIMPSSEARLEAMATYNSDQWLTLLLIIIASTSFSMEFQNNAILTILYKASNKVYVFISKLIVIESYNLGLHLLALSFTVLLKSVGFGGKINWLAIYQYQQPLWLNMFHTTILDLLSSTLCISLILLMSCLINNNAIVIALNLGIIFMGSGFSADILNHSGQLITIMKWNPLNMTNLTTQYYNYAMYHQTTHLLNSQLLTGTILYTITFFLLGYLVFRKKHF
ncbi:ABC transporter permease [Bombilactobacillus bombi]|uniref:ABC transporter permease n=1 Tax=Bombilactobacillus bombi TaxID=1303590 RepID=A0A347SS62_9LACO|nr:ABC transporter permease [Bombilactobacillus bombi]AXX64871.1 ABC transporter permease [Bombilactobacillus bombi]RHW47424.1 ABC transporter permease [Bombilactobacillus bombi]RHW50193.1 ABC transporter permease [Bombilactobacillus bombi]